MHAPPFIAQMLAQPGRHPRYVAPPSWFLPVQSHRIRGFIWYKWQLAHPYELPEVHAVYAWLAEHYPRLAETGASYSPFGGTNEPTAKGSELPGALGGSSAWKWKPKAPPVAPALPTVSTLPPIASAGVGELSPVVLVGGLAALGVALWLLSRRKGG